MRTPPSYPISHHKDAQDQKNRDPIFTFYEGSVSDVLLLGGERVPSSMISTGRDIVIIRFVVGSSTIVFHNDETNTRP